MSNKEKRKELKSRIKKKRQKKYQKRVKTDERLKAKKQKTEAKQNKKAEKLKRKEAKKKSGPVWNHEQKKFLLKQLIRRDFKSRYKRAALGVLWSMLSPLCFFAAQAVVFSKILGRGEHYIAYLITGNIVFHYFSDATTNSMFALQANGGIISKIKVDKDMFLFSRSVSCLINFFFTAAVMFFIIAIDHIPFHLNFLLLIFPVICLFFMNMGIGYILSALFVLFKDTQYLYSIFTRILIYFSAIFYYTDRFPEPLQNIFYFNPVYCYICYFRSIIIDNTIPSLFIHGLCIGFPILFMLIGKIVYKVNDNKFAYYF